ncbi:MAG: hypothetical protein E6J84_06535 [Deltaproteobacteria bacterium]|nr:MAG: hypothetical protein E6J84_06535 [Deltaproteobacteria bacterium]
MTLSATSQAPSVPVFPEGGSTRQRRTSSTNARRRLQVLHHVQPVLVVLLPLGGLAVGDEGDGIGALQDDPPRRVVHHLAWNGEELQLHLQGAGGEHQGERVEEEGPVVGRVQRHQMPAELRLDALVESAEVGRLPGEAGTVVDDLERQLALARVELHAAVTRPDTPARWAFARSPAFARHHCG